MGKIKCIKVKGSSLVETLVATVIIIVVFGIASLTLHNLLKSAFRSNTSAIHNEINKLKYQYEHGIIDENHKSNLKNWEISIEKSGEATNGTIRLLAREKTTASAKATQLKTIVKIINHAY